MSTIDASASASPDPAAIWWNTPPPRAPVPPERRPYRIPAKPSRVGAAIALMILGLVFTPFALCCWLFARGELKDIQAGKRSDQGRGWIQLAHTVSVFVCVLAVAFILTVVLAHKAV